jgi:hypothetical protein
LLLLVMIHGCVTGEDGLLNYSLNQLNPTDRSTRSYCSLDTYGDSTFNRLMKCTPKHLHLLLYEFTSICAMRSFIHLIESRTCDLPACNVVPQPLRYGGGYPCADRATPLCKPKLALASPTGGGRSVGVVRSRTGATEIFFF